MKKQELLRYLDDYRTLLDASSELSQYTKRSYHYDLNRFYEFLVSSCTDAYTDAFVSLLHLYLQELYTSRQLKPSTIKRNFVVLHKFFNYLEESRLIVSNPFHSFTLKMPRERTLPKVLQKQDLSCLLASIKAEIPNLTPYHATIAFRNLAIIDLLVCTGMRIGEIANLNLQDYNQSSNTLLIKGKGQKERLLYISATDVIEEIQHWLSLRPLLHPHCDSLFINKYGNTLSIYGIENIFYKYRERSGISPHSTPHYLRHTFASDDTFAA